MKHGCRGFTLLELMIVIVLTGVMLGMVNFATGRNPGLDARLEATHIASMVGQLRERAVLEGRVYGVRLSAEGYRPMRLESQGWRPLSGVRQWPANLQVDVEQEGHFVALARDEGSPQWLMLSSDETSVFSLTFSSTDRTWLRLSSDGLGEVVIDG
ncbi:type II secretion system protein GspH [Pseudomonas syringae]|nr:type II secretion system protein GspH [Pseudomonas syringae]MCF5069868.1 type II secretion system protein GspH [Pseudomonas syringae]